MIRETYHKDIRIKCWRNYNRLLIYLHPPYPKQGILGACLVRSLACGEEGETQTGARPTSRI